MNIKKSEKLELKRAVLEVFGGCNYTCQMCPQSTPGRGKSFTRKMPLDNFKNILNQISPKYGYPQINIEGSGEPTMAKDLPEYITVVKEKKLKCFMYCNGARLNGKFMEQVIDAGIDFIRISIIGYNKDKYKEWMNIDNFELIKKNIKEINEYIKKVGSKCIVSTYHLITDNDKLEQEINLYKDNVINELGVTSYIWKMHNWSGNYDNPNPRKLNERKSCGRPFAPEITVRAGGLPGRTAAMVPCCLPLGPPNEEKSVLGHLDTQSFEEVFYGEKYEKLRDAHTKKEFDKIDYCKDCDFLYDDNEVLVWSNDKSAKLGNMLGTGSDFVLTDYIAKK
jgi:MoaA/NifB/PqqE/SkfB family radical SAM enzyme